MRASALLFFLLVNYVSFAESRNKKLLEPTTANRSLQAGTAPCLSPVDCHDTSNMNGLNSNCGDMACDSGSCRFIANVDSGQCSDSNFVNCLGRDNLCTKGPQSLLYSRSCNLLTQNCHYSWIPLTAQPTSAPTPVPTFPPPPPPPPPSPQPTSLQTTSTPSMHPTHSPTSRSPTDQPTLMPTTAAPSMHPTHSPTSQGPTNQPTLTPTTSAPSMHPTHSPTSPSATDHPTSLPVVSQTITPTHSPTLPPNSSPNPSARLTPRPTVVPTKVPTEFPILSSAALLTISPTHSTTFEPTVAHTYTPTVLLTANPTDSIANRPASLLPSASVPTTSREPIDLRTSRPTTGPSPGVLTRTPTPGPKRVMNNLQFGSPSASPASVAPTVSRRQNPDLGPASSPVGLQDNEIHSSPTNRPTQLAIRDVINVPTTGSPKGSTGLPTMDPALEEKLPFSYLPSERASIPPSSAPLVTTFAGWTSVVPSAGPHGLSSPGNQGFEDGLDQLDSAHPARPQHYDLSDSVIRTSKLLNITLLLPNTGLLLTGGGSDDAAFRVDETKVFERILGSWYEEYYEDLGCMIRHRYEKLGDEEVSQEGIGFSIEVEFVSQEIFFDAEGVSANAIAFNLVVEEWSIGKKIGANSDQGSRTSDSTICIIPDLTLEELALLPFQSRSANLELKHSITQFLDALHNVEGPLEYPIIPDDIFTRAPLRDFEGSDRSSVLLPLIICLASGGAAAIVAICLFCMVRFGRRKSEEEK